MLGTSGVRATAGVALLERFAAGLDAEVVWVEGTEHELFSGLREHQLDVVIGGIESTTPYAEIRTMVERPA